VVRKVFIYQPDGDRSFTRVGELGAVDNQIGGQWGALARTEYDGKVRFVWALIGHLRIYTATGPGQWHLESIVPDPAPAHFAVFAYDLNRNGRDEIYWLSDVRSVPSLVLERPTLPTDLSEGMPQPMTARLRVAPSPCRSEAAVFLDAVASQAADWSVYDASGRLVLHESLGSRAQAWVFPARTLAPGLYFLRVTDEFGRRVASGRAIVVR
jgi:hypothetical protein